MTWMPRITGVPMELRAALGVYDAATGATPSTPAGGGVVRQQDDIAGASASPKTAVRVVCARRRREFRHPQQHLSGVRAGRLGGAARRPPGEMDVRRAKRRSSRDYQGRDLASRCRARARRATATSWRCAASNTSNVGALCDVFVPLARASGSVVQRLPHAGGACARPRACHQHDADLAAYRSAGPPEVMFVMERLIDLAARRHGFDRVELRRRNLVPRESMPYRNPFGIVYDSGDYAAAHGPRRSSSGRLGRVRGAPCRGPAARGRYRGIGIANYIEHRDRRAARARRGHRAAGRAWSTGASARCRPARVTRPASPSSSPNGSASSRSSVRLITGDTDSVQVGGGSHSGALDAARRRGHARRRTTSSRRAGGSPRACSRPRRRTSSSPAAFRGEGHRPLGRPVRGGGGRAAARDCRTSCAGRSRRSATRP